MSLEDIGAYAVILDHLYLYSRPLRNNDRYLAGLLRCDVRKWYSIKKRLLDAGKLIEIAGRSPQEGGGFIDNRRVIEERSKRDAEVTAKRSAGHKGGIASGAARGNKDLGEAHASS